MRWRLGSARLTVAYLVLLGLMVPAYAGAPVIAASEAYLFAVSLGHYSEDDPKVNDPTFPGYPRDPWAKQPPTPGPNPPVRPPEYNPPVYIDIGKVGIPRIDIGGTRIIDNTYIGELRIGIDTDGAGGHIRFGK